MRDRAWPFIWRICVGEEKTITPESAVAEELLEPAEEWIDPFAGLSDCFKSVPW
jgi:hypothetical protein